MPDTSAATGDAMGRRGFLARAAGLLAAAGGTVAAAVYGAAVGYPIYRFLMTPARRAEALGAVKQISFPVTDLPPVNTAKMFKFGAVPAVLIHLPDGSFSCFNAVCTHLGCTVQFEPAQARIHCACHGGVYDMKTGANVSGPPPKPLTQYTVEIANGQVSISRT
ncbi:MAG TPA: Rieske (2Fe-2S) protein [Candidatus Hydrogenedentes bacterium]|nr:Rieske (2Fe-2S) protein [Candidatus Hydrogenedentota bacterium]